MSKSKDLKPRRVPIPPDPPRNNSNEELYRWALDLERRLQQLSAEIEKQLSPPSA